MIVPILLFALPNEVKAIGDPEIQSITIKQGNTTLQTEGDYYIAPGTEDLSITYTFLNVGYGSYIDGPFLYVSNADTGSFHWSGNYTSLTTTSSIDVDLDKEYETYEIKVCEAWGCSNVYQTYTFSVKYTVVTEAADDVYYFTKVIQNGEEVEYDSEISYYSGGFRLNNLQDATFYIEAENLTADMDYGLLCEGIGYNYIEDVTYYTGTELMSGVTHTCIMSKFRNSSEFRFMLKIGKRESAIPYKPEPTGDVEQVSFQIYGDATIKSYDAVLKYTASGEELIRVEDDYWSNEWHYLSTNSLFDAAKTISAYIKGTDYENKNYNVKLSIFKGNESVYTRNVSVAGSYLNAGYNAEYSGFNPGTENGVRYTFRVTIDEVSTEAVVEYLYTNIQINITKVTQGYNDVVLEKVGDTYIATGFNRLYAFPQITNYSGEEELYIREGNGTSTYYPDGAIDIDLNEFEQETEELVLIVCADMSCEEIITYTTIKVRFTHFDAIQNMNIYFYSVTQAGTAIPMQANGTFNVNNKQDISVIYKGENLINDATYSLSIGGYSSAVEGVTATELANGVTVTASPNTGGLYIIAQIGDYEVEKKYFDGTRYYTDDSSEGIYLQFNTYASEYNKDYEATLKYKNFNEPIVATGQWQDIYPINTKYHNSSNPLQYHLEGSGYENINYTVTVKVLKDGETQIYSRDFTVNGNNINNGTDLDITGLTLPFPDNIDEVMGDYGMSYYYFYITVDYVETEQLTIYNGVGANVRVSGEIFFQNGKKNLSAFRGFGNSGMYDTNVDVFRKFNKIYINFMGEGFDEEEEYDYIIDYGYYNENGETPLSFPNQVRTGKVTGEILNNVGIFVELDNNKNYQHPSYRFYVKKGTEILAYTAPVIYTTEKATLASAMLNTANRDLYLYTDNYTYIATKDMPISIAVSGIGFDENKDYQFTYEYYGVYDRGGEYYDYDYEHSHKEKIMLNGKNLNDGTVKIDFHEDNIDDDVVGYEFAVYGEGEDYFGQGYFTVQFVENKDFLPTLGRYVIEDASDIIKNIKKQTTAEEFINTITVTEGGTLKVFDKTGTTEITGQIGTGMQGRLIDEYDRNFMNIGIAVQGDTTGDGNISITDLVKTKKHLLETDELIDVYEAAADVDGLNGITITDLVNMSKDVTGIKELD